MRVGNWGLIVARYRKNLLVYDDLQDWSSWSNGLDASVAVPVATAPVGSFALIMGIDEWSVGGDREKLRSLDAVPTNIFL